jgi:glycerol-3-phosphate dehydrogenase (NAD(P)+)
MNIAMLGAGAFGKALGKILNDNGHAVKYYDPFLYPDVSIDQACFEAGAIVIAIPSNALEDFLANYPDYLRKTPTILATKGVMNADLFASFPQFSAISGPAFASEIIEGKPATFTASAPFAMGLFKNDQIEIELCDDLLGILLCGTLKNIYAIGAGYHSNSENSMASFIQHAHSETKAYLHTHGANPETAELACGLGDLILTCTNDTSRNFTCGRMLYDGHSMDEIRDELKTVEGLNAIPLVDVDNKYPLLRQIAKLCGREIEEEVF